MGKREKTVRVSTLYNYYILSHHIVIYWALARKGSWEEVPGSCQSPNIYTKILVALLMDSSTLLILSGIFVECHLVKIPYHT